MSGAEFTQRSTLRAGNVPAAGVVAQGSQVANSLSIAIG